MPAAGRAPQASATGRKTSGIFGGRGECFRVAQLLRCVVWRIQPVDISQLSDSLPINQSFGAPVVQRSGTFCSGREYFPQTPW